MLNAQKKRPIVQYFIFFLLSFILLTTILFGALTVSNMWCDTFIFQQNVLLPNIDSSLIPTTSSITDPNREVRGVWIATVNNINFPSRPGLSADALKSELDDILKTTSEANLNTIYFQVRPSADALYDSDIFPTSVYLSGENGQAADENFDPLAYLTEAAKAYKIDIYAWINPLRVTYYGIPLSELSEDHPATLHPDWVVSYADGMSYFNAGIPEVRQLVADGITEIVTRYDVAGVIFDDYFYPYPKTGDDGSIIPFDDADTYDQYGKDRFTDIGDFRRESVNELVRASYDAVKAAAPHCSFGIAPFGIWQNDDGQNGGSETKGLSSYSALYADSLAWIEGGYLDFIAPQIYWQFSSSAAPYGELVRWWNEKTENTDVKLLISHAIYNYEAWDTPGETEQQIEFARSELSYRGSTFYGYEQLKANTLGVTDEIRGACEKEIIYCETVSNGRDLMISSPSDQATVSTDTTYIIGASDPAFPLTVDGETVGRTKSGYFSLYVSLKPGKNIFTFRHKDIDTVYTIYFSTTVPQTTVQSTDTFMFSSVSPSASTALTGGQTLTLTAVAPHNSTVTAELGGQTVTLSPKDPVSGKETYLCQTYTGTLQLPNDIGTNEIRSLGTVNFSAERGKESVFQEGGEVRILGKNALLPVEVTKDDTELKIAPGSWYYDDYVPAAAGMRDYAVKLENGFYRLRMGGYIAASDAKELTGSPISLAATLKGTEMRISEEQTHLIFCFDENLPLNCTVEGDKFNILFYNADAASATTPKFVTNPLFSGAEMTADVEQNRITFSYTLIDEYNFYGFSTAYDSGTVTISLRNPQKLSESTDQPLSGKTIILDAGHGGTDPGAIGPLGLYESEALAGGEAAMNEKDLNLAIILRAKEKVEALGAEVILTRESDTTVDIYKRLELYNNTCPDLAISVHQNSMAYNTDITKIRGFIGLYWADSGKLLTSSLSSSVASALRRLEREPTQQRLALVRNRKFPASLIEIGFITSVEEYEKLMQDSSIDATAEAIAQGIVQFYQNQEQWIVK